MPQAHTDFIRGWKKWIEAFVIGDIKKALDADNLEVGLIIRNRSGGRKVGGKS